MNAPLHRVRRVLAAAALVALASAAFAVPDSGGPPSPLDALRAAIERQDDLVAKDQVDTLLAEAREKAKDGTPESLYLLGRALGNAAVRKGMAGEADAARRLLEDSQRSFEDAKEAGIVVFAPAYLGLARCARYRGESDAAAAHLRQALKLAPAFREAAIELSQVLGEKGDLQEAERVIAQQLAARPADPDLHVAFGTLKLARGRLGEAEREFRIAVQSDGAHAQSRMLLAKTLVTQQAHEEAAEHLETYRRLRPKDPEGYTLLFYVRAKLKQRERAVAVLDALRRELPGSDAAVWAEAMSKEYTESPELFEQREERTPDALIRKLDSKDPAVVVQTLVEMRAISWPALPGQVYKLLAPDAAPPEVRSAAVGLIGSRSDPRTLTVLEILLHHPRERDPDVGVRRAAAAAIAGLPTKGVVPILMKSLDDGDPEIRESAVRGIAANADGKYFREKLETPTPAAAWPAERALYDRWWRTQASASLVKRDACEALFQLFQPIKTGRRRLAEYALPAMDDANERTWRAGYDLFRSLTGQDFGGASGEVAADERARIAKAAAAWLAAHGNEE